MDALLDEVESLEAILMDDVRIQRDQQSGVPVQIETTVLPVVGEDEEQQYVCVTLQVLPLPGYPDVSPDFKLSRPRGLDDARLGAIKAACLAKLKESLGYPVVFDLIEVVREHLTGSNLPSGQCVICLYGFIAGDDFTRTECFHYLHSYCLVRHLNASRRNYHEEYDKLPAWQQKSADPFRATCPVCREHIKDEADKLKCAMPPAELQNAPDFKLTSELRELQERMSSLFLQQKSRGAIIDVDAESGSVISIESEEEVRRRLQRKLNKATSNGASTASAASEGGEDERHCEASQGADAAASGYQEVSSSSVSTNFSPVVQQTQRIATDPTNNNYQHQSHQHKWRHYRGGRRHQPNHHHRDRERDRERERERYENHHPHSATSHAAPSGAAATTATATGAVSSTSGKQPKGQTAGGSHAR